MDFPMTQTPLNYPISLGMEPLPTLPGTDAHVLGRNIVRHHPVWDFLDTGHYKIATTQLSG